jgi:photosystem II stability/assembly factor-like uncharacterized protein
MFRYLSIPRWFAIFVSLAAASTLFGQQWQPVGPEGGSVRSLAFDPKDPEKMLLGTSAGRLYQSSDGGSSWSRFARLGNSAEMVLDHILIDPLNPRRIYVAAWNAQAPNSDGDIYYTRDGGKTWDLFAEMHGKSVRALAMAPGDPNTLVAGALDGIFRTRNGGESWERISPEHHAEIKNVESIAVDPVDPDVIYAGTWHLPWKTDDGGKNWHSIKKGVIDDSDVFTILIDPQNTSVVYISACSGIYRSENAGELFRKIQGIPYSARRTRMLRIDPNDHRIVFAGTTEGLWKSTDSGSTWKRMTGANLIVNDVMIDPRRSEHVLLATDRAGVLASNDAASTFSASNHGFTHRQVSALLVDTRDPSLLYVGLLNDKEFGGVFSSRDAGHSWTQISDGLEGRDVLVLRRAPDGSLIAGTDRGIFQLNKDAVQWLSLNTAEEEIAETLPGGKGTTTKVITRELSARVNGLEFAGKSWFAATSAGVFESSDSGKTWRKQNLPSIKYAGSLAAADRMVVVAGRNAIAVSVNAGESWLTPKPLDPDFMINAIYVDSSGTIWLAAREGVFRSSDVGDTWKRVTSLRLSNVTGLQFDEENQRILATGAASMNVFESTDNGRSWSPINAGWLVRQVTPAGGRLVASTPFDGIILQHDGPTAAVQASGAGSR